MPTPSEKKLLYIENQMKEADAELCKIPPGAPSYQIMRRLILCSRDLVEVIRALMPEPGPGTGLHWTNKEGEIVALRDARRLAADLDFSDSIPPGAETKILPRLPDPPLHYPSGRDAE